MKLKILEWKQRCNTSGDIPTYEVIGQMINLPENKYIPLYVSQETAAQLQREGLAKISHAVDSAIDFAEDFSPENDYVPGPYLS